MTPEHFLLLWENQQGSLKDRPELRELFLERAEVGEIITYPEDLVRKSLLYSPKLETILEELAGGKVTPERPVPYGPISKDMFATGPTTSPTHRTWQEAQSEMS